MATKIKKTKKGHNKKPLVLPPILAAGTIVPVGVGFAIVAALTQNIPVSLLIGLGAGFLYWLYLSKRPQKAVAVVPTKTADDIVLNVLSKYAFVMAEPADVATRPEAYSIDGLRWSHKLKLETENGETDIFVIRGSLVTGEGELEFVDGESRFQPSYWEESSSNSPE